MTAAPHPSENSLKCLHCERAYLPQHHLDNWTCLYCYSCYLSIPMLTNLLSRDLIRQITENLAGAEVGRPCPRCQAAMRRTRVARDHLSVEVEFCPTDRLVWFDAGKLAQLTRFTTPDSAPGEGSDGFMRELLKRALAEQRQSAGREPEKGDSFVPWGTGAVFALCLLLAPVLGADPELIRRFGFVPAEPFRLLGLTWITSALVNPMDHIHAVLLLVPFGYYAERRLGTDNFIRMLLAATLASRLAYGLHKTADPPLLVGALSPVLAAVAYALMLVPYREILFPEQKYKSELSGMLWILWGAVTVVSVAAGWQYFHQALSRVPYGGPGTAASASWLAMLAAYLTTPTFAAHLAGAAIGLLWYYQFPPRVASHRSEK